MRPILVGSMFLLVWGCSGPDLKSKLVGTWQHTEAKTDMPITYNADGTYVQSMTLPDRPNATAIAKGTYKFDGTTVTTIMKDVQVYGLIPAEAAKVQGGLSQTLGQEIKTTITFVSDDEFTAEAGKHKLTFKRVAGTK